MTGLTVPAYAKINLTLDVLGKREDNYHEVSMILQSINLRDLVTVSRSGKGITIDSNTAAIPADYDNLAYRAALLLKERTGFTEGIHIYIEKNIPVAAGLGGGSADAAATLIGINYLLGLGLTPGELICLGKQLGADVPFCILGGTALVEGIGEKLTILPKAPTLWLVLAKPEFGVSTAEVYRRFDKNKVTERPDNAAAVEALAREDMELLVANMVNVLETVTLEHYPEVARIKDRMLSLGAMRAVMCGSGPTVMGVFGGQKEAEQAYVLLKEEYPEVFLTRTR
ncbi:4-(cytidine 5'-diphospho)-2-C-methyl-D-erythritol kinase [Calderihabitans maritimus]|uniref:4-diphosphocytidyl-2-C-methyl-D-erythritol kinase n=1 Tax=Calderihabitans maritimus TaxID=1246530 RepID=A0A1Z5HQU7_9FIRM|nr:4-(cytidine 5'-diphospho)-2-C-methyl-D-erythritol kinase [Calderihabitans maritimus]GAW91650.1 4-diphosphocytidyl-2-C-methyl-D-erythritol kinase [Calderihabitans maritimus]